MSCDNLTLVGHTATTTAYAVSRLVEEQIVNRHWITSGARFHYNLILEGGALLQLEHDSSVDPHSKMKERRIRLDFNPNKITRRMEPALLKILGYFTGAHITRKDIAIDIFDSDLSEGWNIYDIASRKQVIYKSGIGKIETVYFGAGKSEEVTRIYNKALEQGTPNEVWWRIETQMRGKKAQIVGYPAFNNIKITRKGAFQDLPVKERAMLYFLQDNPESLTELSHASRLKYKKMLIQQTEKVEIIPLNEMFASKVIEVEDYISSWLEFTKDREDFI